MGYPHFSYNWFDCIICAFIQQYCHAVVQPKSDCIDVRIICESKKDI